MQSFTFSGLGTTWSIMVDHTNFSKKDQHVLIDCASDFENKFSRFKDTSEVGRLNNATDQFTISHELKEMFTLGLKLNKLTNGYFDLNINKLITGLGYDKQYSFKQDREAIDTKRGSFEIKKNTFQKKGLVETDLGSLGKGYLIDKLARLLKSQAYSFFLIEGGGDIYATTKKDNSSWNIALEHPLDPQTAIGQVSLKNQAITSSSSQKRKTNDFHHLLDPKANRPSNNLLFVSILASNAFLADALATAMFVTPQEYWPNLIKNFEFEYLAVNPDMSFTNSPRFSRYLFQK